MVWYGSVGALLVLLCGPLFLISGCFKIALLLLGFVRIDTDHLSHTLKKM